MQRKSLFLWAPVFMACGIVTYFTLTDEIGWFALGVVFSTIIIFLAQSVRAYSLSGKPGWLSILLISFALILIATGYGLAKFRTDSLNTPMLTEDMYPRVIEGTIEKLVLLEGEKAKRVVLNTVRLDDERHYRVRLKTYHFKEDHWQIGDHVSVKAKLMAPGKPVIPSGFDFSRKAYYDGLSAVGYTMSDAVLLKNGNTKISFVDSIRTKIASQLYQNMDARYAAVAQALLTGERASIEGDDTEALRASGLAHLLAISGLHIGLVAGCVFFFVRLGLACIPNMALHYPIKKWAAGCAIIVAFSYMILAGATVPTVRAFIMTSLVLLAIILDRSALNMRLVALAALFVMITTPEAVIGPSFVLSFAAVSALIVFYRDVGRRWLVNANAYKPLWRPFYYLFGVIVTSLVATAATAPFSVLFFNRFAIYSVLSNVLAMPLMAFIVMPVGLLATLFIPMNMDSHFWVIMEWGIAQIIIVADSISSYKNASIPFPSFGSYETFLICTGFVWFILWKGYLRLIGATLIIFAFVSTSIMAPKAILISDDMKAILIVDKSEDSLYLIGKMNSYLKSNWLGFYGYDQGVDILINRDGDEPKKSSGYCDDFICRFNMNDVAITVIHNPLIGQEACKNADIVISNIPLDRDFCEKAYIIDRFDIWRHGATQISFKEGKYNIKTVNN